MPAHPDHAAEHQLVADPGQLAELLADWRGTPVLAIDTEFERTITYFPRPALMQLCANDRVLLVDLPAVGQPLPLFELLADPATTKVIHAGSEDMEVLQRLGTPAPAPLFDTQIAAAFAGVGFSLGYSALAADMLGLELSKEQSRSDWLARPLSAAQLHYAVQDVAWLPELHERLVQRLTDNGRLAWLQEECARITASACVQPDTSSFWQRLKGARALQGRAHAVLRELADWREREARARNRPRNHILKEAVLYSLAEQRPASPAALATVEGMPAGEARRSGETLCAVIADARENDDDAPSPLARRAASDVVKQLKKVVRRHAQAIAIEPALLAPNRLLESLLVNVAHDVTPCLPDEFRGWRRELVGEALLECARQEWSRRGQTA